MKELITTDQLALRWGVSEGTLKNWRSEGKGPPYLKLDNVRSIRYRMVDIIAFEEKNMVKPGEKNGS